MAVILKILNGIQNGIEIHLHSGEYSLGSSPEDDIELLDSTVHAQHARITISADEVVTITPISAHLDIAGSALPSGQMRTVAPFDIIFIGAAQITIARSKDDWPAFFRHFNSRKQNRFFTPIRAFWPRNIFRLRTIHLSIFILSLLASGFGSLIFAMERSNDEKDLRVALEQIIADAPRLLDTLHLKSGDGEVPLVHGIVTNDEERTKILTSLGHTHIPFNEKILTATALRKRIDAILASTNLTYELNASRHLQVRGITSAEGQAASIRDSLQALLPPLEQIDADIQDAAEFEHTIRKIALATFGGDVIDLALEGSIMIAQGSIPAEATDSWISFLTAYDARFAAIAPLRSHVTLETAGDTNRDTNPTDSFTLGDLPTTETSHSFDLKRLRSGKYGPEDLFTNRLPARPAIPQPPDEDPASPINLDHLLLADSTTKPLSSLSPGHLYEMAKHALALFQRSPSTLDDNQRALTEAMSSLDRTVKEAGHAGGIAEYWAALSEDNKPCWTGTHWSAATLPMANFWIDLLVANDRIALNAFSKNQRAALAEIILNPQRSLKCTKAPFLYAQGVADDPNLPRRLLKSLPTLAITLVGRSLAPDRYLQILAGNLLREGDQIEEGIVLRSIGELGTLFIGPEGPAAAWYSPQFSWEVLPRESAASPSRALTLRP